MKKMMVFYVLILTAGMRPARAEMDWERYVFQSTASSAVSGSELLYQDLKGIFYDANQTISEFLQADYERQTKLLRIITQYQTVNRNYLTDGGIENVYRISLTDKIMALLIPPLVKVRLSVPMLCPCCGQEWPQGKALPPGIELTPKEIDSGNYSGIIIDCRGLPLTPALFPVIYNEIGDEICSVNFADPNYVIEIGLFMYATQEPYNNPRIGYNPLRVRAIGITGKNMTDIKISSFDARRIHGSIKNLQLLKECRVAVIFGP